MQYIIAPITEPVPTKHKAQTFNLRHSFNSQTTPNIGTAIKNPQDIEAQNNPFFSFTYPPLGSLNIVLGF